MDEERPRKSRAALGMWKSKGMGSKPGKEWAREGSNGETEQHTGRGETLWWAVPLRYCRFHSQIVLFTFRDCVSLGIP